MGTYSDYEQRLLDQQSGEEMDRLEQRRERREARDTIATAPIGPAHVFADADNNGLNARVLPAAITSNEQVEQLISEYQLAIDVRSHHTPLGRIDRIKRRCEETIAALQELQQRRSSHEAPPIPPSSKEQVYRRALEQIAEGKNPANHSPALSLNMSTDDMRMMARVAISAADRLPVETAAEPPPCPHCLEAHALIDAEPCDSASGNIADRVGDVIEQLHEAWVQLATWQESCTGKHGSQQRCIDAVPAVKTT